MTTKDEALKLALEALETVTADVKTTPTAYEAQRQAITALREALAEPAQPSQRSVKPWVKLTDEEIDLFINGRGDEDDDDYVEPTGDGFGLTDEDLVRLVRRAEAKLQEKNT